MTTRRGFLLLGFPRSGTTLLSRLLNAHPYVSCPPETYAIAAAARFLHEQDRVEGPPIGVLSGLAFCGIPEEDVLTPLRDMVIAHQTRIAGDAAVWIEKTAVNIFYLDAIETLFAGHVRFIVLERHPLDVIASNLGLADVMGAQLDELHEATRHINCPVEGLARAWANRAEALDAFCTRHSDDVCRLTYEDLTHNPHDSLDRVFEFIGQSADLGSIIETAFAQPAAVGLGDFSIDNTTGIRPAQDNKWRTKIGNASLARILTLLAGHIERLGQPVPKAQRPLDRKAAVRQFQMASALKRDLARKSTTNRK